MNNNRKTDNNKASFFKYPKLFLIIILAVTFLLRIPSLLEPYRYADEEIYLTLGQGLRKGLVLYRDIHDNKPPFIYLLAAIVRNKYWLRFSLLCFHTIGVIFFWKLAELIYQKQKFLVVCATWLFAILSTLPLLEGNIANGENFMIVPAIIGIYYFYKTLIFPNDGKVIRNYPIVGLLFSFSFLFKVPIVFDFIALVIFFVLLKESHFNLSFIFKKIFSKEIWYMILAFIIPILISILYYSYYGAFEPYVKSALMQNVGYLSTWGGNDNVNGIFVHPLIWRGILILGIIFILLAFSSRFSLRLRFLIIWFSFSLYGAFLSSRPYPHYLLQPLVPFSLIIFLIIFEGGFWNRAIPLLLIVFAIFSIWQNKFWYYPTLAYYKNFIDFAAGQKSWEGYLNFWNANKNYQVARYLALRTSSEDRLFVWGTEPSIYILTDRLPIGKYTVAYHVVDFNAYEQTIQALESNHPKYIVVFPDAPEFKNLNLFLNNHYVLETDIEKVKIYRWLD